MAHLGKLASVIKKVLLFFYTVQTTINTRIKNVNMLLPFFTFHSMFYIMD